MIYELSWIAVGVFSVFVAVTLGISFYFGSRTKSSQGYFAAHGQIHWFVNGVAFAGDYLSAASFLGICGMIAFFGYDGFLYSIGYLAGWIVALFVIAEPMKRLGKYTFADALDSTFDSRAIKLAAGISTLVVSLFYLIPQMVGAGALIRPLFNFPHWVGVLVVGSTVILIVVTAGMVSTTYVQFLKGGLLIAFSTVLVWLVLERGLTVARGGADGYAFENYGPYQAADWEARFKAEPGWQEAEMIPPSGDWGKTDFIRVQRGSYTQVFSLVRDTSDQIVLREAQTMTKTIDGKTLVNGLVKGEKAGEPQLHPVGHVAELPGGKDRTGSLGPIEWFRTLQKSKIVTWGEKLVVEEDGAKTKVFFPKLVRGAEVLRPGESPTFKGIRSEKLGDKMDFLSLMLALFCGTASLPHILIRYYTVKDESSARKSTIVGIGCIGLFYVLTLYMGLGAMTSGALDVSDNNMSAPLLARSINEWLFAAISAIAFTTVLGTVSGLILASSGAVTHDLVSVMRATPLNDADKVRVGKVAATVVGLLAMALGILFQEMNVNYLVGWAFSVAASANLPALVMLLFWKGTTKEGIVAGVLVGLTTSLAWILVSADTYTKVYGWKAEAALVPFSQPGIVTIPLGFAALVSVSWLTKRR